MCNLFMRDSAQRMKHCSVRFEVKATDDTGRVEGYGSVFNVQDSYDDIVAKGAFAQSLADHKAAGTMPAMLWQHDTDEPIGVWAEMSEDAKGLKITGQLALDTVRGKEAHALLKMGALNGLSIGFISREWNYDQDTETRTLTKIDLWEVSIVTFPANSKARVQAVKSSDLNELKTIREAEDFLRDAGLSNRTATAFIALVKRMVLDERDAREATTRLQAAADRLLSQLSAKEC